MKCTCNNWSKLARHRVIIQTNSRTTDNHGSYTDSWGSNVSVWAVIEPRGGSEIFESQQQQSRVSHVFIIRYQSSLKDTGVAMQRRITYDGRVFDVKYINNLAEDMKNEGKVFQKLGVMENEKRQ